MFWSRLRLKVDLTVRDTMRRREFIRLLGGAVISAPFAGNAQQVAKTPVIGFLGASSRTAISSWTDAFVQRLGELGWIDGRNVRSAHSVKAD